jgi:hypothetical protein
MTDRRIGTVLFQRIGVLEHVSDGPSNHEKYNQPDHEKHEEQNLRNPHGGACDSRETQNAGDEGNNEKNQ